MAYKPGPNDEDWRFKKEERHIVFHEALDKAFENTKDSKAGFTESESAKTMDGKTIPVEYQNERGAEVSVDFAHETDGPDCPHVGWQTAGKRNKGAERGHILLNFVPAGRNKKKD